MTNTQPAVWLSAPVHIKLEMALNNFCMPVCIKAISLISDNYYNVCLDGEKIIFTPKRTNVIEFDSLEKAEKFIEQLRQTDINSAWDFEIWSKYAI